MPMVLWPRSYLHISRVSYSRKEQCGGGRGSRWNAAQHPTHLALEVVNTGSATELPVVYRRPSDRKPRPPIFLCRTFDEEVFGVYRKNNPHVAAWIASPGDAHRLTYALGLHCRSGQGRSLAHFHGNLYHPTFAFQSSRVLTIFAARREISDHAPPSTSRGRSNELSNSSTSTPASR